jgi:hypothetical protein
VVAEGDVTGHIAVLIPVAQTGGIAMGPAAVSQGSSRMNPWAYRHKKSAGSTGYFPAKGYRDVDRRGRQTFATKPVA